MTLANIFRLVIWLSLSATCYADTISASQASNGSTSLTENFEQLPVSANSQVVPDNENVLDANTVAAVSGVPVGGPGLVVPGVTFSSTGKLAWNGDNYFGLETNTLVSISSDSSLEICFTQPVSAFGVYLAAYEGYGDIATLTILGVGMGRVIYKSEGLALPNSASGFSTGARVFFFGGEYSIGGVIISGSMNPWSPVIDNLTFYPVSPTLSTELSSSDARLNSTPEPCDWLLVSLGLLSLLALAKRASIYSGHD